MLCATIRQHCIRTGPPCFNLRLVPDPYRESIVYALTREVYETEVIVTHKLLVRRYIPLFLVNVSSSSDYRYTVG